MYERVFLELYAGRLSLLSRQLHCTSRPGIRFSPSNAFPQQVHTSPLFILSIGLTTLD